MKACVFDENLAAESATHSLAAPCGTRLALVRGSDRISCGEPPTWPAAYTNGESFATPSISDELWVGTNEAIVQNKTQPKPLTSANRVTTGDQPGMWWSFGESSRRTAGLHCCRLAFGRRPLPADSCSNRGVRRKSANPEYASA